MIRHLSWFSNVVIIDKNYNYSIFDNVYLKKLYDNRLFILKTKKQTVGDK